VKGVPAFAEASAGEGDAAQKNARTAIGRGRNSEHQFRRNNPTRSDSSRAKWPIDTGFSMPKKLGMSTRGRMAVLKAVLG
jgi:hypothetical protein